MSALGRRLVLKLETAMAFEALILNRLAQVPAARRQDWLRGLLIEGFKTECRALRRLQRDATPARPARQLAYGHRRTETEGGPAAAVSSDAPVTPVSHAVEPSGSAEVSLATLRRVMG